MVILDDFTFKLHVKNMDNLTPKKVILTITAENPNNSLAGKLKCTFSEDMKEYLFLQTLDVNTDDQLLSKELSLRMLCIAIKYGIDNKYIKKNAEVHLLKNIKNIDEYIEGDFHVQRILSKYDMKSSRSSSPKKSPKRKAPTKLPTKKEPKPCKEHRR